MKLSQAKEYLPLVHAAAEGKKLQCKSKTDYIWKDIDWQYATIGEDNFDYRIKPEPEPEFKLRPWKPEEVPVGCLLNDNNNEFSLPTISVLLARRGVWCHYLDHTTAELTSIMCHHMLGRFSCSLDHGISWKPCGIQLED